MGSSQAVKVVTFDILEIFTPSEHVIQILRFTPVQPNRKKIPIRKAENGSMRKVTLVRRTGLIHWNLKDSKHRSPVKPLFVIFHIWPNYKLITTMCMTQNCLNSPKSCTVVLTKNIQYWWRPLGDNLGADFTPVLSQNSLNAPKSCTVHFRPKLLFRSLQKIFKGILPL